MLAASHAQSPARPESQIGRYQITIAPKGGGEGGEVFRLDTTTGKTSVKALTSDGMLVWSSTMPEQTGVARETVPK
jgi:hypothetical protein